MLKITFSLKISLIVVILHICLFLHQAKCYPNIFFETVVNFVPSDDCPENSLCENPKGYPKEFIRQALMKNREFHLPCAHGELAYGAPAPESASVPESASAPESTFAPESASAPAVLIHAVSAYNVGQYAPASVDTVEPHFRTGVITVPRLGNVENLVPRPHSVSTHNSETNLEVYHQIAEFSTSSVSDLKEVERYNAPIINVTAYDKGIQFHSSKPELCPSLIKTLRPKSGTSANNEKLFIINEDEILTQEIDIEICGSSIEEAECKYIEPLKNSRAVCRQKYIIKELIALSPDGRLQSEGFKIPSYCCCDLIDL